MADAALTLAYGEMAGSVGSFLSVSPTVLGASGAVSFSVSPPLPSFLSLAANGTVSGTPTAVRERACALVGEAP